MVIALERNWNIVRIAMLTRPIHASIGGVVCK